MLNALKESISENGSAKPFAKRLRWKIAAGDHAAERVTITPFVAREMLQHNVSNRPLTKAKMQEYAGRMKAGKWRYTGEAIIFSNERLIDGQHRLLACITADSPFDALVVFDAPDEAFAYIDQGKARTGGDIFHINGVQNAALCAAMSRWLYAHERGYIGNASKSTSTASHAEIYEFFMSHPDISLSVPIAGAFAASKLAPPSLMGSVHYLAAKKNRASADDFFEKVADGIGFAGKKDPAYRLHKRLVDNAVNQEKLGRKHIAAFAIKAWNAHRLGRDVGVLRFSSDEAFPRVR